MKEKVLKVLMLFFLFFQLACNISPTEYIENEIWVIDKMIYKESDLKPQLRSNIIYFKTNNICVLPVFIDSEIKEKDRIGNWFVQANNELKIESQLEYLNGEYELMFSKDDQRKSVFMVLKNDNFYMKAYRGSQGDGYRKDLPSLDG